MCVNSRWIFNPYSRRKVLVKCGKCPACLQEKACARANRIRNNVSSGTISLFITLTYSNDYLPYIKKSDLMSDSLDINVYRNAHCRFVYSKYSGYHFKKSSGVQIIQRVFVPTENRLDSDVLVLKGANGMNKDCVGVCLNSDFQKFIKRLNQILKRNYNYDTKYSYFYCSEYGSHSQRPHFHALLFIPKNAEATFRNAIVKAWPYADYDRTKKYVEIAKDAASYVSSYVNSHISLSSALSLSEFKQKHNYSQGFGTFLDCFSLSSVLSKIDSGDLFYYTRKKFNGESSVNVLPIPSYVLNRYFPRFKGFGRLSPNALERFLLSFERADELSFYIDNPLYSFSSNETKKIYIRLSNAFRYFKRQTGLNSFDYCRYYVSCWRVHASVSLMLSYRDIVDFDSFYENALDAFFNPAIAPTLDVECLELNPNARFDIVESTNNMLKLFDKLDKQKKVTNLCMSSVGHNV